MEISEVRVKLIRASGDRLKAVCTVTFEGVFVVRDVKVVDGTNGMFVAMPSRKLSTSCPTCRQKNHLRAKHCNECGKRLPSANGAPVDPDGMTRLHRDIAHPITSGFRAEIQAKVIEAYEAERELAMEPTDDHADEPAETRDDQQRDRQARDHDERPDQKPEPQARDEDARDDQAKDSRASDGDERDDQPRDDQERVPYADERADDYLPVKKSEGEAQPADEYGDMIAGLQGGRAATPSDRRDDRGGARGRASDAGQRSERSDGRGRGGRGRGRGREPRREDRPAPDRETPTNRETTTNRETNTDAPAASVAPVEEAPAPVQVERAKVEPPAPPERTRVEPASPREPQPADLVSLDDAANEPATTTDSSDDSSPFGLGL